jgi:N-formylglutamate amidohydrolase
LYRLWQKPSHKKLIFVIVVGFGPVPVAEKLVINFEENPVRVLLPEKWTMPLVFSSPHSGNVYPQAFVDQTCLSPQDLRQSEDYNVHALFEDAPHFGAPLLHAHFPRAYCDVNREAYEIDPDMFKGPLPQKTNINSPRVIAGIGTIPKMVAANSVIYDHQLDYAEAEHRLSTCYFPYHTELKRLIDTCRQKFGYAIIVDCHSMPGNSQNTPSEPQLSDIVLGNRFGRTCPAEFSDFIASMLTQSGYSLSFNTPYAGGYITRHYSDPAEQVHALQIEINRDLYMTTDPLQMHAGHEPLVQNIQKLLQRLNGYFSALS